MYRYVHTICICTKASSIYVLHTTCKDLLDTHLPAFAHSSSISNEKPSTAPSRQEGEVALAGIEHPLQLQSTQVATLRQVRG